MAVLLAITSKRRSQGRALWLSPLCSLTPNWSGHCPRRGLHLGRAVLIPSELKLRGRAAWGSRFLRSGMRKARAGCLVLPRCGA